ncbi:hypothetical protein DACRYDRAFT_100772 [Dacryopinax primogenitus]|uniref:Glycosyltransferase 2-like domain-containing protein n=1 Tax=Dacryopinax primogenitus (strain DJM 731) TaxID=1858805 RepID=M5GA43_DACPD|nr:uncharacterized protein DACRYDRAFT_100772 [Dacryopinax primogenitus]EJU00733.1 hypothetical protein DACRYDRAFT_100772 [Dacryopinax primogenitus]
MSSQFRSAYGMIRCWWGTRQQARTDWVAFYREESLKLEQKLRLPPTATSPFPHPQPTDRILPLLAVEHIIILPNYKESLGTLRETLDVLASHPLANRMYKVCLAMEERESGSGEKAALLADEYGRAFLEIAYCLHPAGIPGESAGKSSNVAWASRFMAAREMDNPTRLARQVVTVMDSDTCFAADFFLSIAVKFALAPPDDRDRIMFAPPILFDRNQDEVPVFTRVTDIMWACAGIGGLYPSSTVKIPTSAYSVSMGLAVYVGFWDAGPEAIGEDMHMFTKCMFDTCGHLKVETIYSPASQCNVVGAPASSRVQRLINDAGARWTQAIRHMWGSLDTGYAWNRALTQNFGPSKDRGNLHLLMLDSRSVSPIPFPSSAATVIAGSTSEEGSQPSSPSPSILENESENEFPLTGTVSPATTLVGEEVTLLAAGADGSLFNASSLLAPSPLLKPQHMIPLSPPSAWKTAPTRIWPMLVLLSRLYEAHIMIAHFFLMVTIMNFYPSVVYSNGSFALMNYFTAPSLAWSMFRTPYAATPPAAAVAASAWGWLLGGAPLPTGASVVWVMPDLVAASLKACKLISGAGFAFSVVMVLMHDFYHREAAGKRWDASARASASYAIPGEELDEEEKIASSSEEAALSFPPQYLGIRPHQTSRRHLPWCMLDFVAIPCGLAFGVAPLIVAQFRHVWTNKLMYTVSAKPTVQAVLERDVVLGVGVVEEGVMSGVRVGGGVRLGGVGLGGVGLGGGKDKMEMEVLGVEVVREEVELVV